jgi:DNA-binding LytR/AlgR family response regulator
MIRIAICDDEKKILDEVSGYIKNYAEKKSKEIEVFRFDSAASLIGALEDGKPFDIFVLDVYIGDERGTVLARDIRKLGIESPIIFATTSVDHAPESYEMGTLRYLIKPINPVKFYEALDVALAAAEKIGQRLVKLKTENGVESINATHILYSEAHAHYQYVTLDGEEKLRVRMTVSELYTLLAPNGGFIRVGSAYIINLRNVKNVSTSEVHLYNNITVPIPRGKHSEIKKAFWDFQCEE